MILLGGEEAEPVEAEPSDQCIDIDEVACLSSIEQRQQLVSGQLLDRQHGTVWTWHCGPDASIGSEVDLGDLVTVADRQAGESVTDVFPPNGHPGVEERSLNGGHQGVDVVGGRAEEIEITGLAVNDACQDQRGAAGQRKLSGFGPVGDEAGDALL